MLEAKDIKSGDLYYVQKSPQTSAGCVILVMNPDDDNEHLRGLVLYYTGSRVNTYTGGWKDASAIATYLNEREHKKLFNLPGVIEEILNGCR